MLFSFTVAAILERARSRWSGAEDREERRSFRITAAMCPRCEGRARPDFDLSAFYDDSKSLTEGALTLPSSHGGLYGRIFTAALSTRTSRSQVHHEGLNDLAPQW